MLPELNSTDLHEFYDSGVIVFRNAIEKEYLSSLSNAVDELHDAVGNGSYNQAGRWDMRNCISSKQEAILNLLTQELILSSIKSILGWNVKLLSSHIVKMKAHGYPDQLPIHWHRDGGCASVEIPEPLPQLFIKAGVCVSGSSEPNSGELLTVPGSHRLTGAPTGYADKKIPNNFSGLLLNPGDLFVFDWRLWHAVCANQSSTIRRTIYLAFGYRWLAPMDYVIMPSELQDRGPLYKQLLGGSTELGNYLPTPEDVPLRNY